jgi:hypothetical protein
MHVQAFLTGRIWEKSVGALIPSDVKGPMEIMSPWSISFLCNIQRWATGVKFNLCRPNPMFLVYSAKQHNRNRPSVEIRQYRWINRTWISRMAFQNGNPARSFFYINKTKQTLISFYIKRRLWTSLSDYSWSHSQHICF